MLCSQQRAFQLECPVVMLQAELLHHENLDSGTERGLDL